MHKAGLLIPRGVRDATAIQLENGGRDQGGRYGGEQSATPGPPMALSGH